MITTTTNSVEGRKIKSYEGIVFGEVVAGTNIFRDIGANIRDTVGGRSAGYEKELANARFEALDAMTVEAYKKKADAIVGIKFDYEVLGKDNGMLMVTCSGTAVTLY